MRKIFAVLALTLACAAHATTTVPSSLINWVTPPSAPSQTAKYVFAAPNAAAGVPTFRLLLASDIYGLGTAATVNTATSGATIPLLNGANTWAAAQTFSVRPTFNAATPWDSANRASPASTVGVINGSNASAGAIGEYKSADLPIGTPVSLTTGTAANVTSVSLSAGD